MTDEKKTAEERKQLLKDTLLYFDPRDRYVTDEKGIKYYREDVTLKAMEAYAVQQKSEIKMPTKEAIVQYFNNHFNCHADVIIGDYETTETAMTVDAVLKMIEWLRNQTTER